MIREALVLSEFVSIGLALVLVYFLLKICRFTRSPSLLGLPIGFSHLALSYTFLALYLLCEENAVFSDSMLWLRLITQSFGFAFIAFSYYFSAKTDKPARYLLMMASVASVLSIIVFFVALLLTPSPLVLPLVGVAGNYSRVLNLAFLGYVIYHIFASLRSRARESSDLVSAPIAFSVLWLAQYSLFIWGVDGSMTAFTLAHVARLASLILFIRVYYSSGRVRG